MPSVESQRWALVTTAIDNNDMTLLDEAVSMTAADHLKPFYHSIRSAAIAKNSLPTLRYLIQRGVSVEHLRPPDLSSRTVSIPTLDFLIAHGWDIDWRGDDVPFLWFIVRDGDMVAWCLEHGASVTPVPKLPRGRDSVLERAAASASVATFELLRSKGAPLGQRTLHRAVETAAVGHTGSETPENDTEAQRESRAEHTKRMQMVHHLLNVVRLDVNAPDQPPGQRYGMHNAWGTPICYIPGMGMPERDARELTWLLLDRGADPTPALKIANEDGNTTFVGDVDAWKAQNSREDQNNRNDQNGRDDRSCCVQ